MNSAARDRVFRLRADTFYVRKPDGVWLRNDAGACSVRGRQSYQLVDAVAKELDGVRTVDQICAGLTDPARNAVLTLITTLHTHGFLKEVTTGPESVPTELAELYGDVLGYLDHYLDEPVRTFIEARRRPVTCIGDGAALHAIAVALAELGLAAVRVVSPDPRISGVLAAAAERDASLHWRLAPGDEPGADGGRTDAVLLLATDGAQGDTLDGLAEIGHRAGALVGALAPLGDRMVATPLTSATDRWSFADLYRITGHRTPQAEPDTAGQDAGLPAVPVAMLAHQLAMRVLCALVGPPLPQDSVMTSVQQGTLTVLTHRPRRLVTDSVAAVLDAAPPVQAASLTARPDVPSSFDSAAMVAAQDAIVSTSASWIDPVFGPLLELEEEELAQLPLAGSRCRVLLPGRAAPAGVAEVRCYGLSGRETRNQSILLALELLAGAALERHEPAWRTRWQIGAGWTTTEALLRADLARLRRSRTDPEPAGQVLQRADLAESAGHRRRFLVGSLDDTAAGVPAIDISVRAGHTLAGIAACSGTGQRTRTAPARAAGLVASHAVDQVLLEVLVARSVPDTGGSDRVHVHAVLLSPGAGADGWTPAADGARDLSGLLPFLHGAASVVAVPLAGGPGAS